MLKSLYLINPLADFPSYFSAEVFGAWGFTPATSMADLAIAPSPRSRRAILR